jgi:hypothetical protein
MPCNGQSDDVNKPKFFGALILTWLVALVGGNLHILKVEGGYFTTTTWFFKVCSSSLGQPESCATGVAGGKVAVSMIFWCLYMAISGAVILLNACRIRKRCTVWCSALATAPLFGAIVLMKKYHGEMSAAHAVNFLSHDAKLGPSFAVLVVALALQCVAVVLIQKDGAGNDDASAPADAQTVVQTAGPKHVV